MIRWADDEHLSREEVVHGLDFDAFREAALDYDPVPPGVGFTRDTPVHDRKQAQLAEPLTTAFDRAMSELYELIPGAEERLPG